jgi:hypothetical protein
MVRCSDLGRDNGVFSSWNGSDPSGPKGLSYSGAKGPDVKLNTRLLTTKFRMSGCVTLLPPYALEVLSGTT